MFNGKKIIITGESSGVGKKLAQRLIEKGADLALIARDENKLLAVKKELLMTGLKGQTVEVFPCDVADSKSVEKAFSLRQENADNGR